MNNNFNKSFGDQLKKEGAVAKKVLKAGRVTQSGTYYFIPGKKKIFDTFVEAKPDLPKEIRDGWTTLRGNALWSFIKANKQHFEIHEAMKDLKKYATANGYTHIDLYTGSGQKDGGLLKFIKTIELNPQ